MKYPFLGEYRHSVDSKSRVAVPNSFRRKLSPESEGRFALQVGRDRTIEVHPLSEWREFVGRALPKLPRYQPLAQRIRRGFARVFEVEMDSQGRILVPKLLLEHAGVVKDGVLAGAIDYFEIWEPGRFDKYQKDAMERLDKDLEEIERLGWGKMPENDESDGRSVPSSGAVT